MKNCLNLLFILAGVSLNAQKDTICTRKADTIYCTILKSTSQYIEYRDLNRREKTTDLHLVKWYTHRGTRITPSRPGGLLTAKLTDTVNAADELRHLRFCLHKFHNQYSTGMSLTLVGALASTSSLFLTEDNPLKNGVGIGGLLLLVSGAIVTFDAHKWIGRAGWGVNGKGNEVEIYYRFR